jgi:hypothetical protein
MVSTNPAVVGCRLWLWYTLFTTTMQPFTLSECSVYQAHQKSGVTDSMVDGSTSCRGRGKWLSPTNPVQSLRSRQPFNNAPLSLKPLSPRSHDSLTKSGWTSSRRPSSSETNEYSKKVSVQVPPTPPPTSIALLSDCTFGRTSSVVAHDP